MTAVAAHEAGSGRRGLGPLAVRILRMEIRHSAFVWCLPVLVVLFIYDPYRTAAGYPALWPVRSTVVLNKFWPDMVIFAAGFAAWAGSRESRRNVGDLLATTARPAWARQLCSLAGTMFWVLAAFLAGVLALYVRTAQQVTWGTPPIAPVVTGVAGMVMVCAVGFALGALFPGRFTAPIVAVALMIITLVAFRQAVGGGNPADILSPDGSVPANDWGVFYPASIGVPIVRLMFMGGVALAAVGLLGLSPRSGGVGWRGALSAVSGGGARLRSIALSACAAGAALAVAGVALAATATGSPSGGYTIPALDSAAGSNPIPYTPVCSAGSFQVCLHPAFRSYLPQVTAALRPVIAELAGLPGVPVRAANVPQSALSQAVLFSGGDGQVAGTPPVYDFTVNNAVGLAPGASLVSGGFQQDIVHAVIVGGISRAVTLPDGQQGFQPTLGTPAQQAVVNGLLQAIGAPLLPRLPAQVVTAAARFAALPAATRHAWLAANLAVLRAGTITVTQVP